MILEPNEVVLVDSVDIAPAQAMAMAESGEVMKLVGLRVVDIRGGKPVMMMMDYHDAAKLADALNEFLDGLDD